MRRRNGATRRGIFEILEKRDLLAGVEHQWLGAVNDDWHTPGNWNTGSVPDEGDIAIFNKLAGSNVKLYAVQDKDVAIVAKQGTAILDLNGFDFDHRGISTLSRDATTLTINGPGALKAPSQTADIAVGGIGRTNSALFNGLDNIEFRSFEVGGLSLMSETFEFIAAGAGSAELRDSGATGQNMHVGPAPDAVGELHITSQSDVQLSGEFFVGIWSRGDAWITDSQLSAVEVSVGEGVVDEGNPEDPDDDEIIDPELPGNLTITRSNITTTNLYAGAHGKGDVVVDQGSVVIAGGSTYVGFATEGRIRISDPDTELRTASAHVGDQGEGSLLADSGAMVRITNLLVGIEEDSYGLLSIESGATAIVELRATIAVEGVASVMVTGAGSVLNAGQIHVGTLDSGDGLLNVANGGHVIITDVGRIAGLVTPNLWLAEKGVGRLTVWGTARVDMVGKLSVTGLLGGDAYVNVFEASNVVAAGNVEQLNGFLVELNVDDSSQVKGNNGHLGQFAAANIEVKGGSTLEGTHGLEIGGGGPVDIALFSDGILLTEETIDLGANTSLRGDSTAVANILIRTVSSAVSIEPQTEAGNIATLTFQTPSANLSAGMTLAIDAPAKNSNDLLRVTGSAALGGLVNLNMGFTNPTPWMKFGSQGDVIHVIAAGSSPQDSLTGYVGANLPPISSLDLPPGYHFEWRAIYDRDDLTADEELEDLGFASQPWLGNGTKDVLFIIVEVPPGAEDDWYETYEDGTIDPSSGDVTTNDPPPPGSEYEPTVELGDNVDYGVLTLNPDGTFTYDPDLLPPGVCARNDYFTYQAVYGLSKSDPATVTLFVKGRPEGLNDEFEVDAMTRSEFASVLGNDECVLPEMDVVLVSDVTNGDLTLSELGNFEYHPDSTFWGTDSFTYKIVAGSYETQPATVTLVMELPQVEAEPEEYWSFDEQTVEVSPPGVLGNDINGTEAQLVSGPTPSVGSFSFNPDGSFTFDPGSYDGDVTFQYKAIHTDSGVESDPATVTIHCVPDMLRLDGPVGAGNIPALTMAELVVMSQAAIERWRAAGVDDAILDERLADLHLVIADLPDSFLGGALDGGQIVVDINGAGHGWFADATPSDDREFERQTFGSERRANGGQPRVWLRRFADGLGA